MSTITTTFTMTIDELARMVSRLTVAGDCPRYSSTEKYLVDLLPTLGIELDEDENGTRIVHIEQAELDKIDALIEAYNEIQCLAVLEDEITDEQAAEICGPYDPTDLDEMNAVIKQLEAQLEENQRPHGEILQDGWQDLEDGRKLYVENGRAVKLLRYEGREAIEQRPYRWSKTWQVLSRYSPWATAEDMAAVEWMS